MNIKPFFPITFDLSKYIKLNFQDNAALYWMIVEIVVYLVASILVGAVLSVLGWLIGFLGFVWWIVGSVFGVYVIVGIVLSVLKFCKVIQ